MFFKQKSGWLLLIFAGALMAYGFFSPEKAAESIRKSMELCAKTVLPSLFLFSVAAKLLVKSGALFVREDSAAARLISRFGLSAPAASCLILGFLSGFPTGASVLADAVKQGELTRKEAKRLLPFANNAGASFLAGAVGVAGFGSARLGRVLFAAQLASALFCVMLTARGEGSVRQKPRSCPPKPSALFASAIWESVCAMLSVTGCIVFFSVLADMLPISFFSGFLELSGGLFRLFSLHLPRIQTVLLCGMLLGFGGLSVLLQVADRVSTAGISMSFYLVGKVMMLLTMTGFAPFFVWVSEKKGGGFVIFMSFALIFALGLVKNKIFFKKTMEKRNGMLYNRNEIECP